MTGRGRVAPVAGVALLSVTVTLVAIGAVLVFGRGDFGRIVWGLPGVQVLWALGFSAAGYPITRRHPANPVGWLLMVAGVAAGVNLLGLGFRLGTTVGPAATMNGGGPATLLESAWVFSVAALSSAVVLFPSGSPPSRWWLAQLGVLWGFGVLTYLYAAGSGFAGLPEWSNFLATAVNIIFQIFLAAGCFSLLVRWRHSVPVERLQLKWVMYGAALTGVTALVVETGIANLAPAWHLPGTVVLSIVILAVPVTMGVAMLRYRLYDIDVVINRTLVYGALTATLALVYVGIVVSLQYAFRVLTGEGSQLVIVASTLGIAALFNPLRRRIQDFVDRLFYRRKYDAAKTLGSFSSRLRDETDLDALGDDLVAVVRETVQPERVSLWLREPNEGRK
ncbi:MAG: hypothetical protein ACRDTR_25180, partial [Rubrobacter sp.]